MSEANGALGMHGVLRRALKGQRVKPMSCVCAMCYFCPFRAASGAANTQGAIRYAHFALGWKLLPLRGALCLFAILRSLAYRSLRLEGSTEYANNK